MIKFLLAIFLCSSISAVLADSRSCADAGLTEAYRSVEVQDIDVCFAYTDLEEDQKGRLSNEPRGIAIYSISHPKKPALIYELPYAGTKGKINDAFIKSIDGEDNEMLFIIHSMEKPSTWDSLSDIYDVNVINIQGGRLVRDIKLSRFFDMGGDLADAQGNPIYAYPYKDRKSIENAIVSPIFRAMNSSAKIKGTIKEQAIWHEGDIEPTVQNSGNEKLTKGEQIVIHDAIAGWCKVSLAEKKEPTSMWVQCKMISFTTEEDSA